MGELSQVTQSVNAACAPRARLDPHRKRGTAAAHLPLRRCGFTVGWMMSKDQQEAFRGSDDRAPNLPERATNRLAVPLPIFTLLLINPAIAAFVSGGMQ